MGKLLFIGLIEHGKKPNFASSTFADSTSWYGALARRIAGEGRQHMLSHIENTMVSAYSIIEDHGATVEHRRALITASSRRDRAF